MLESNGQQTCFESLLGIEGMERRKEERKKGRKDGWKRGWKEGWMQGWKSEINKSSHTTKGKLIRIKSRYCSMAVKRASLEISGL